MQKSFLLQARTTTAAKQAVIDENKINNFTESIRKLTNLKSISDNPLIALHKEVCQLKKLESIVLENTKISKLPKCLENLQNLEWINVSGTELKELPIEILNAPQLETIHAKGLKLKNYKGVKSICEKRNITFYYDEE